MPAARLRPCFHHFCVWFGAFLLLLASAALPALPADLQLVDLTTDGRLVYVLNYSRSHAELYLQLRDPLMPLFSKLLAEIPVPPQFREINPETSFDRARVRILPSGKILVYGSILQPGESALHTEQFEKMPEDEKFLAFIEALPREFHRLDTTSRVHFFMAQFEMNAQPDLDFGHHGWLSFEYSRSANDLGLWLVPREDGSFLAFTHRSRHATNNPHFMGPDDDLLVYHISAAGKVEKIYEENLEPVLKSVVEALPEKVFYQKNDDQDGRWWTVGLKSATMGPPGLYYLGGSVELGPSGRDLPFMLSLDLAKPPLKLVMTLKLAPGHQQSQVVWAEGKAHLVALDGESTMTSWIAPRKSIRQSQTASQREPVFYHQLASGDLFLGIPRTDGTPRGFQPDLYVQVREPMSLFPWQSYQLQHLSFSCEDPLSAGGQTEL